ncbi:MAG: hypothetical protein VCA36_13370 [Opitutales bacterium]
MKTRLVLAVSEKTEVFAAAATRIRDITLVDVAAAADAIITDELDPSFEGKPTLLVESQPDREAPWLFPALSSRFSPEALAIRESLDSEELGQPGLMRMHLWTSPSKSQGKTAIIGAVDLALWLFGAEPESVHGVSDAKDSASCSVIHLGFPQGGMAVLDFTNSLPEGEGYRSLSLIGSRGAAYADDHRNRNLFFDGGAPQASCPSFEHAMIQPMLQQFLADVSDGKDSASSAQSYRRASDIVSEASRGLTS